MARTRGPNRSRLNIDEWRRPAPGETTGEDRVARR